MTYLDIFIIGIGLSMDAFAVSICKGLAAGRFDLRKALIIALWFGTFQGIMPAFGFLLGSIVSGYISRYSGIVAFILLFIIGAGMIKESREESCGNYGADVGFKTMLAAAVATSIDALSVGVTFSAYRMSILRSSLLIAATTFVISAFGVRIGALFGDRYKQKAEFAGGVILIVIGVKLLLGI